LMNWQSSIGTARTLTERVGRWDIALS